jgi:hypothetical protein
MQAASQAVRVELEISAFACMGGIGAKFVQFSLCVSAVLRFCRAVVSHLSGVAHMRLEFLLKI